MPGGFGGYGIEAGAESFHIRPEVHRGIEDARAVQMDRKAAALGELQSVGEIAPRDRLAADRVLQRKQSRAGEMRIVGADGGLDLIQIEGAIGPIRDNLRMDRAQHA